MAKRAGEPALEDQRDPIFSIWDGTVLNNLIWAPFSNERVETVIVQAPFNLACSTIL